MRPWPVRWSARLAALALLLGATRGWAGGIEIPDNGAQAMGRGGAFVAKADDPSCLAHNPAGLAKLGGTHLFVSGNAINERAEFTRAGVYPGDPAAADADPFTGRPFPTVKNGSGTFLAPMFVVTTDLGGRLGRLRLALGLFGPPGYGDPRYPGLRDEGGVLVPETVTTTDAAGNPIEAPAPQRYDLVASDLVLAYTTFAAAYRLLPTLDIGAELMWITVRQDILAVANAPLGGCLQEDPSCDIYAHLQLEDDFSLTGMVGALWRPADAWEVGLSVRPPFDVEDQGTAIVTQAADAPLSAQVDPAVPKTTQVARLPLVVRSGARFVLRDRQDGGERADVELDVVYEGWKRHQTVDFAIDAKALGAIELQDIQYTHRYRDVVSVRLGGALRLGRVGPMTLSGRLGGYYELGAAPEEYSRLDFISFDRFAVGGGLAARRGRFGVDLFVANVFQPKRTVSASNVGVPNPLLEARDPPREGDAIVGNGVFDTNIFMAGASVDVGF